MPSLQKYLILYSIISIRFKIFIYYMSEDMSGFSRKNKLDKDEYYLSSEGFLVFTEKYLLKRGFCCKNGCKHCPYGFNKKTGKCSKL